MTAATIDAALTDALRLLPPEELHRVSRLRIAAEEGAWWLSIHRTGMLDTVSYALRAAAPAPWEEAERDLVAVDVDHLPDGIEIDIRRARPMWRYPLDLWEGAERMVPRLLRALHASGIVGGLNVARLTNPDGSDPRWTISTHAATQAERNAWVLSI